MTTKLKATIAALSVVGVLLAGCSSDSMDMDDSQDTAGMAADSQTPGTMADITFAQMMIPHHEQAVVMSGFALTNTDNPQILALAQEIMDAQGPEIAQMNAILERINVDMVAHDMGAHGGDAMAGMLTEDDMAALQSASGSEFDQLFLTGMIAHHVGAIDMAKLVLASGSDPEVRTLAEAIIAAQQTEIDAMQGLLAN